MQQGFSYRPGIPFLFVPERYTHNLQTFGDAGRYWSDVLGTALKRKTGRSSTSIDSQLYGTMVIKCFRISTTIVISRAKKEYTAKLYFHIYGSD